MRFNKAGADSRGDLAPPVRLSVRKKLLSVLCSLKLNQLKREDRKMAPKTPAELKAGESNVKALMSGLGKGCQFNKRVEQQSRVLQDEGLWQTRERTCRSVTGCVDPSENVPESCDDWSDWHN
jgi:hypothetical protein